MSNNLNHRQVIATALCVLLFSVSAGAAVPIKPVKVEVTNQTPIPVTLVTPAAPDEVICSRAISGGGTGTAWVAIGGSGGGGLDCPPGVSGVNARRVIYDPLLGPSNTRASNFSSVQMILGLSDVTGQPQQISDATTIVGMFSSGDLEKTLAQPVPILKTGQSFIYRGSCGGIPGLSAECGGGFIFIGTPIQ